MIDISEDTISISWHIDDVKHEHPRLTDAQCREVLAFIKKNHDATIGISWDVISCAVCVLYGVVE
jgi:hypothetical protein